MRNKIIETFHRVITSSTFDSVTYLMLRMLRSALVDTNSAYLYLSVNYNIEIKEVFS